MPANSNAANSNAANSNITLGIIGAGHIGSQLARLAVAHHYSVVIANSRGPQTLTSLVTDLGGDVRAGTPLEAARAGDVVVVTIPLWKIPALAGDHELVAALADKTVIDTCNYYPQRDGSIAPLDEETLTTSEWVAGHLPGAHVVKAFNHIAAAALAGDARPNGSPERRALAIFGDDDAAKAQVAALIDTFGFDPLDGGLLAESWRIQRDTPGYVTRMTAPELGGALSVAVRPAGA